jgi:hypothetical protein
MQQREVHVRLKGRMGNQLFQFWRAALIAKRIGASRVAAAFTCGQFLHGDRFPNVSFDRLEPAEIQLPRPRPGAPNPRCCSFNHEWVQDRGTQVIDPDRVVRAVLTCPQRCNVVQVSSYSETYTAIKRHERFVRELYARTLPDGSPVPHRNVLAVHVRDGDLEEGYARTAEEYAAFAVRIASRESLPVVIVGESRIGRSSRSLVRALRSAGVRYTHSDGSADVDFDVLYSARAIVMANSCFSWWPAFLNPHRPRVYAALSPARQPHGGRSKPIFFNGPAHWALYNLDTKLWFRQP